MTVDALKETVPSSNVHLPIGIDRLWIDGLKVGLEIVNLAFAGAATASR